MKWVKKFEAKRIKSTIKTQELADRKQQYLDRCEDIDERSYVSFDAFFKKLDFNIFSKHNYEKFYSAGIAINREAKTMTYGQIDGVYISNSEYGNCDYVLKDLKEWQKRNAFIYAEVNTGGASGGSCWDGMPCYEDSGATPYEGSQLDLHDFVYDYLNNVLESIISDYPNDKSVSELCDILYNNPSIIKEGTRTNYEYYGNYDDYSSYYITLGDLFEFLLKNGTF